MRPAGRRPPAAAAAAAAAAAVAAVEIRTATRGAVSAVAAAPQTSRRHAHHTHVLRQDSSSHRTLTLALPLAPLPLHPSSMAYLPRCTSKGLEVSLTLASNRYETVHVAQLPVYLSRGAKAPCAMKWSIILAHDSPTPFTFFGPEERAHPAESELREKNRRTHPWTALPPSQSLWASSGWRRSPS